MNWQWLRFLMKKRPGREESRAGGETAGARMGLSMLLMITIIVQ